MLTTTRHHITFSTLFCAMTFACMDSNAQSSTAKQIDLSGKWDFQIDSLDQGIEQGWYARKLNDAILLPGSMLTNGKGNDVNVNTKWTAGIWDSSWYKKPEFAKYRQPGNVKVTFWLQPLKYYVGPAWYQKKVIIPVDWKNQHIELFLERAHWETTCWIDDKPVGKQNALSAPQIFDLSKHLTPGEHTITLRIDNRIKEINPGLDAHSVSDNTQTNWNGIVGEMKLTSRSPVYFGEIQLYPDIDKKIVTVDITIYNIGGIDSEYQLELKASEINTSTKIQLPLHSKKIRVSDSSTRTQVSYSMGNNPLLWDEFHPNLYSLNISIGGKAGSDTRQIDFGMRKLTIDGTRFRINGRPLFFRGTLECAIFPKTGYTATSFEEWSRIFSVCKKYGLNHVRFHSWCPPEAAFQAADRAGIYLAVENSAWANLGSGKPIDQYLYDESNRIVSTFGNHPSFCLMPYGNEASGEKLAEQYLSGFVKYWQAKDKRRLYTSASGFPGIPESDFESSGAARIQWWEAGLTSPINSKPPTSDYDWTQYIHKEKPTISHEIGQWCVYPNFKEMKKYTGPLKPRNFEIFQEKLQENGMAKLADSFLLASGKLQVLCYKADIEAALRTPGFGGFQLLDLHDFPGQGTALVGVLDPFWEEKGYTNAKEFSRFCNSTVPLLRLPKMIYLNNEQLVAKVEVAHFGEKKLQGVTPSWKINRANGQLLSQGKFSTAEIPIGLSSPGSITTSLNSVTKEEKLTVTVTVGSYANSWEIWVYPAKLPSIKNGEEIRIVQVLDNATQQFLENGGKVLLTVKKGSIKPEKGGNVQVGFSSIFWNTQWTAFKQPPFTLGILCNPKHPALAAFPTEYHSNWQWWDAMSHSNVIRIDSVSKQLQPIVRVIDDWFTARPIALIFECKVGKGKLLVSGVDLIGEQEKRAEARQLLFSLKKYMTSPAFNPSVKIDADKIISLFL